MHFNWTVTGDGLATLAAGIIAFCAVWWQVRSSACNLQKQLDEEKRTREEEGERRKRVVATAILFEVDNFYEYYLRESDTLLSLDVKNCKFTDLLFSRPASKVDMAVYCNGGAEIASLDQRIARLIVAFYGAAGSVISSFSVYLDYMRNAHLSGSDPSGRRGDAEASERVARLYLRQIQKGLPKLKKLTYLLCYELCKANVTNVAFAAPAIAVASESFDPEELRKEFV